MILKMLSLIAFVICIICIGVAAQPLKIDQLEDFFFYSLRPIQNDHMEQCQIIYLAKFKISAIRFLLNRIDTTDPLAVINFAYFFFLKNVIEFIRIKKHFNSKSCEIYKVQIKCFFY